QLAEKAAKEPRDVKIVDESALEKEILALIETDLRSAYAIPVKQDRYAAVGKAKEKVMAHYFPEGQEPQYDKLRIAGVFKELEAKIVRWNILDTGKRIDGRDSKTVRNIIAELGAGRGQRLRHLTENVNAAFLRLAERHPHDLLGDARDLDVHLQRGDALIGAGHLEVHVAEMILVAEDVREHRIARTFENEAHRDARGWPLQRNA